MTWVRIKHIVSRVFHSDAGWLELTLVFVVVLVLACLKGSR